MAGKIVEGSLDLLFGGGISHTNACVFSQTFVQLKRLLLRFRAGKQPVAFGAKENCVSYRLLPLLIGARLKSTRESAPLQLQVVSPIDRIKLCILSTFDLWKFELVLNAVKEFVRNKSPPLSHVIGEGPQHLRPVNTGPFDRGIRDVLVRRQEANKNATIGLQ